MTSPKAPTRRAVVSLLTDFGLRDPSAAICKGVIVGICRDAQVIDIGHEVTKYSIREGAILLWCALPYLPVGVHVAVVDPGVGTARRPIAVVARRGDVLIGPDNGLLLPALERLGGLAAAYRLTQRRFWREPLSNVFHGRDIFSPVAAQLANGVPIEQVGEAIDPASLVVLDLPQARPADGGLDSAVIYLDSFGNAKLAGMRTDLEAVAGALDPGRELEVELGGDRTASRRLRLRWTDTFGHVAPGEPILLEDAYGRLLLSVNQGNAARELDLHEDLRVRIRPATAAAAAERG